MDDIAVTSEVEFKELNATLRHYSNMRFLAMPIFFAINGAFLVGLQNDKLRCVPYLFWMLAGISLCLFLFFASFEYRLQLYIERFVERAKILKPDCFWSARPGSRIATTGLLIVLYGSIAVSWLVLAVVVPSSTCSRGLVALAEEIG